MELTVYTIAPFLYVLYSESRRISIEKKVRKWQKIQNFVR
nr:MAG TPA: hypothetical protein [Caudoviricetes sp.]